MIKSNRLGGAKSAMAVLAMLVSAGAGGCAGSAGVSPDARYQKETVRYLASNHLEGRGPGTRGLDRAGDFIANEFRRAGLKPGNGDSYFQNFEWNAGFKLSGTTRLSLGEMALAVNEQYRPNSSSARGKEFSGEVVFAGYGIASERRGYDDWAGLEVKDKVVLVLRYEPRTPEGKSRFAESGEWSNEAAMMTKVSEAQKRGAAAVLIVNPPVVGGRGGGGDEDALPAFSGRGRGSRLPVVQVKRAALDAALAKAGQPTLAELAGAIDSTGKPASRALAGLKAGGRVDTEPNKVPVRNVMAILPGSGARAQEFVVVGAHYDHLGFGGSGSLTPGSTDIHPGADDNASGTTAMLTIARRMAASPTPPERSILFQAYTVEEQGLIGSAYWVKNPTVPIASVAYMLNLDMVGRLKENVVRHGGEGTAAPLDGVLAEAFAGSELLPRTMGRGGFGPSDHASFAAARIPVIFLFTGLHPQYHRPTDTADTINFPGMLKVTDVAQKVLLGLTKAPKSAYNVESDRQRQDVQRADQEDAPARPRVGLGLVPDMGGEGGRGMKIDGVLPGSAAERAGMKAGDVLLELSGKPVDTVEDLQGVYENHQPGDKVKAKIRRGEAVMELEVTFAARSPST
jgi:hypothetical protein